MNKENYLKNIAGYSLNCKTFIDVASGSVAVKFDNASQQDSQYIHYNVFSQRGYVEVEEYDLVLQLMVKDSSLGGDIRTSLSGHAVYSPNDGRHYTVVFPDHFVNGKNNFKNLKETIADVPE